MQGDWSARPFAIQLLEQHQNGKTVEQLSRETGIPVDRVEMRLNAATACVQRLSESGGTGDLTDILYQPDREYSSGRRHAAVELRFLPSPASKVRQGRRGPGSRPSAASSSVEPGRRPQSGRTDDLAGEGRLHPGG